MTNKQTKKRYIKRLMDLYYRLELIPDPKDKNKFWLLDPERFGFKEKPWIPEI